MDDLNEKIKEMSNMIRDLQGYIKSSSMRVGSIRELRKKLSYYRAQKKRLENRKMKNLEKFL